MQITIPVAELEPEGPLHSENQMSPWHHKDYLGTASFGNMLKVLHTTDNVGLQQGKWQEDLACFILQYSYPATGHLIKTMKGSKPQYDGVGIWKFGLL